MLTTNFLGVAEDLTEGVGARGAIGDIVGCPRRSQNGSGRAAAAIGTEARRHLCALLSGWRRELETFAEAGVYDFAASGEQRVSDFVGSIEVELAVFYEMEEESGEIARRNSCGGTFITLAKRLTTP